jgi:glyoxylase-like metal-dependent hydrolase (beta-lactamase superfamily II)
MLSIIKLTLGPVQTNTYVIANEKTREAVVIDPAWDGEVILAQAVQHRWHIGSLWLTHAHFDHLGGAAALADGINPPPPVAMHPEDQGLWRNQGGAVHFGMHIDPGPEPTIELSHGQILHLGEIEMQVRHTPGHTRGGVVFYCPSEKLAFVGDLIFQGSVGRTDLPGGDFDTLIESIRSQVLSLPDETRLLPGHGPETTVGIERETNPFLS